MDCFLNEGLEVLIHVSLKLFRSVEESLLRTMTRAEFMELIHKKVGGWFDADALLDDAWSICLPNSSTISKFRAEEQRRLAPQLLRAHDCISELKQTVASMQHQLELQVYVPLIPSACSWCCCLTWMLS